MNDTATNKSSPTRDRLLDVAHKLFYRDGSSVGIESVSRTAKVSKRSMYQLFESKDELIAASLERAAPTYLDALIPAEGYSATPRGRIMHVFQYLEESSKTPNFRGCPFVATAVELKSEDHPASLVARNSEGILTAFFREEARRGGATDPDALAEQLTVIFDGASSHAVVQARPLNGVALATAEAILNQAGLSI